MLILSADHVRAALPMSDAIRAFKPTMQEIPIHTVARARLFVDDCTAASSEAGDIVRAIQAGVIDNKHIVGEIGDVIGGRITGSRSPDEVTLFKSVGIAAQDAACAGRALARAGDLGIGQSVVW